MGRNESSRQNTHEVHHPVGVRVSGPYAEILIYCPTLMPVQPLHAQAS